MLGAAALVLAVLGATVWWVVRIVNDPLGRLHWRQAKPAGSVATQGAAVAPSAPASSTPKVALQELPPAAASASSLIKAHPTAQQMRSTPARPRPEFVVQLGAFSNEAHAKRLAKQATRAGFPSSALRGTTHEGKDVYRVQLDKVLEEERARQVVTQLNQKIRGLQPFLVRR
jgi:cell division septation protein DedD